MSAHVQVCQITEFKFLCGMIKETADPTKWPKNSYLCKEYEYKTIETRANWILLHSVTDLQLEEGGGRGRGGPEPPWNLADQITLFNHGGEQIMPVTWMFAPPDSKCYLHLCESLVHWSSIEGLNFNQFAWVFVLKKGENGFKNLQ